MKWIWYKFLEKVQGPRPCHLHSDSWFKNLRILLFPLNCHLACVVTGSHSIVFRFLSWRSPSGSRRCGWSSCRGESWGRVAGRGARRVGRPGVSRFKSACLPRSPGGVFLAWWVLGQAPLLTTSRAAAAAAKSLQSCLTLRNPIDSSPPGSPVPGIFQARILEWVAISFSNA